MTHSRGDPKLMHSAVPQRPVYRTAPLSVPISTWIALHCRITYTQAESTCKHPAGALNSSASSVLTTFLTPHPALISRTLSPDSCITPHRARARARLVAPAPVQMGTTSSKHKSTSSSRSLDHHQGTDPAPGVGGTGVGAGDRDPKASTISESTADSKSTNPGEGQTEQPAKKQVQVLRVDQVETYEDDCNQTGLSEYEMKKMDRFHNAPARQRGRAYTEAQEADQAKKDERRARKEERRSRRRSKGKKAEDGPIEPNTIPWAIQNAKRLGVLNLSKMDLEILPEAIFDEMPGTARIINISNNRLQALEPRMFDYVLVQRLIANGNRLASIHPGIQRMVALKKLDLASNQLSQIPDCFAALQDLELVDLSHNKLEALPPSFAKLDLTDLTLRGNNFKIAPKEIAEMDSLIELDLSDNHLESVPEAWMSLTRLISLKLDNNNIQDFPNVILQLCADLITLSLRGNPIKMNILQKKDAYVLFEERRALQIKRQIEAGIVNADDLDPADR